MKTITEVNEIEVQYECDVVVSGGGTAGIVAALASARQGANTILIESKSFLGGAMIEGAGPLHSFFNLYSAFPEVGKRQYVKGIPEEIVQQCVKAGSSSFGHIEQENVGNYDSVATMIDWESFKYVILEMMKEAGVRVMLKNLVCSTVKEHDCLTTVIVESKEGRKAIVSKCFVDCTGDGDLAALAGVPYTNRFDDQEIGMPFSMANVDVPRFLQYAKEIDQKEKGFIHQLAYHEKEKGHEDNIVRVGVNLKKIPEFCKFMEEKNVWGPLMLSRHVGDFSFINGISVGGLNPLNTDDYTEAERRLRKTIKEWSDMFIKYLPGFERAYVYGTLGAGVRRTRIFECDYDMPVEDIRNGQRHDDDVCLYTFHDESPRIMVENGTAYGIPFRMLLPKNIDGLLLAGRMLSSDYHSHMSTRNTVSCMAQGEAVGTAAALSALNDTIPRNLDVDHLREVLRTSGVVLDDNTACLASV